MFAKSITRPNPGTTELAEAAHGAELTAVASAAEATEATEMTETTGMTGTRKTGRRRMRVAGVAALAVGALAATVGTAQASWFTASVGGSGVNVRDCYHPTTNLPPSTSCTFQATLSSGTQVHIVCQRAGQNIGGDSVWDYITYAGGEGYAADYYIYTGYSSWIPGVDTCQ